MAGLIYWSELSLGAFWYSERPPVCPFPIVSYLSIQSFPGTRLQSPDFFAAAYDFYYYYYYCCRSQDAQDIQLEEERDRLLTKRAILIQKAVRGYLARIRFVRMKKGAVQIQRIWRGYCERQRYQKVGPSFPLSFPSVSVGFLRFPRFLSSSFGFCRVCWVLSGSFVDFSGFREPGKRRRRVIKVITPEI